SSRNGHLLYVRGPPGAGFTLQWAPVAETDRFVDGAYGPPSPSVRFESPGSGDFLLATHDVPADVDAAPISCTLLEEIGDRQRLVARDAVTLRPGATHEQAFNYDGERQAIELQV